MRRTLVVVAFACGCGGSQDRKPPPDEPATAVTPEPAVDPAQRAACDQAALRIGVTPPDAGGPSASFGFGWKGEGDGSASTEVCLERGSEIQLVPRGEHREVTVRAHATELQRIYVHGRPHLMAVVPGASIGLADNPCYGYELGGPNTDGWFAPAQTVYCRKAGTPCRDGYSEPAPPRLVEDPRCGATDPEILRCVADAVVEIVPGDATRKPQPPPDDPYEPMSFAAFAAAAPVYVAARRCGHYMIDTGTEVASLVVGNGERWRLAVEDGRLVGSHTGP